MLRLLSVSALAGVLVATSVTPDAQACQPYQMSTVHLNAQTAVALDGGVLMVDIKNRNEAALNDGTVVMMVNGKAVPHEDVYLGRGLTLWRGKFTATTKLGIAGSQNLKKAQALPIVDDTTVLTAPAKVSTTGGFARPPRPTPGSQPAPPADPFTTVAVHLSAALPDDAVALVVYMHQDNGSVDGFAWSSVAKGQVDFQFQGGGKGCGGGAPPLFAGDKVSFGYVTSTGRLSPQTAAQLIAGPTPVKAKIKKTKQHR